MAQKSETITLMAAAFVIVLTGGIAIGLLVGSLAPTAEADPKNNPKALNGYVVVSANSGSGSLIALQSAHVVCPEGKGPIAGGWGTSGGVDDAVVTNNHPFGAFSTQVPGETPLFVPHGWQVSIERFAGVGQWSMSAWAACVDIVAEAP